MRNSNKRIARQYKRYTIYKAIVALSFLEQIILESGQNDTIKVPETIRMYLKELKTGYKESLLKTINRTSLSEIDRLGLGVRVWVEEA